MPCFGGVWHFLRGACSVLEGHDILEEVLRCGIFGVQCLEGCGIFGGVWHYWRGACSVLEGHDILKEVLAVFWRSVAFWRCLQCFGGVWHFGGVLAVF